MRPLGLVAPEGADWMHLPSIAAALCHIAFTEGWMIEAAHPSFAEPLSLTPRGMVGCSLLRSHPKLHLKPRSLHARRYSLRPPPLRLHFSWLPRDAFAKVQTFLAPSSDAASATGLLRMQVVGSAVQYFPCTCCACRNEVTSYTIEGRGCHFRLHANCATDSIRTRCAARHPAAPAGLVPKARKFNHAWQLTCPWRQCDAMCMLMWCEAYCAHPQLGSNVPSVQGTSNFKMFTIKEYEKLGTHHVIVALHQWFALCQPMMSG